MRIEGLGLAIVAAACFGGGIALAQAPTSGQSGSPPASRPSMTNAPASGDTTGYANLPSFASEGQTPPGSGRFDQRVPDLRYWACDGVNFLPRYTARFDGDHFVLSRIDGGDTRNQGAISFVDWNMKCWTANWDDKLQRFVVKRLPQEEDSHTDDAIHFLAHDLTPWEGYRDGNGWIVRPGHFEYPAPQVASAAAGMMGGQYGSNPYAQQQYAASPSQPQMMQPQMGQQQPYPAPAAGY